jgi:hypothetical protein
VSMKRLGPTFGTATKHEADHHELDDTRRHGWQVFVAVGKARNGLGEHALGLAAPDPGHAHLHLFACPLDGHLDPLHHLAHDHLAVGRRRGRRGKQRLWEWYAVLDGPCAPGHSNWTDGK